jgi:peptidoglycan/xylan/chitin deacetylase (PgdA/CDA1 family)
MLNDLKLIPLMRGLVLLLLLLASPWSLGRDVPPVSAPAPVRFLLTFDDGPSARTDRNPTASILDQLADNPIQAPIKAIFFVQTRDRKHGGSAIGQRLLRRLRDEGHLLAVHSGTARGHINHTQMPLEELEQSLNDGSEDIRAITGVAPRLVRPPYWDFTNATLDAYARNHLRMLMYDIRVNDGKSGGINYAWRLRLRVAAEMRRMRDLIQQGVVPVVGDTIPLIVAFHDTNRHTAKNLQVFMRLLLEEAGKLGLAVAPKPFFDDAADVGEMAMMRSPDFLKWANASGLGRRHP